MALTCFSRSTVSRFTLSVLAIPAMGGFAIPHAPAVHYQVVHCRMTKDAIQRSFLFDSTVKLLHLGEVKSPVPYGSIFVVGAMYADPRIGTLERTPAGLVMAGSVLEDGIGFEGNICTQFPSICGIPGIEDLKQFTFYRALNHFEDPNGGKMVGGEAAQVWGWDGADNDYSWKEAIAAFNVALTAESPYERQRNEEKFLVAIGCSMHLLQDLSSPAHARLDPHIGHNIIFGGITNGYGTGASQLEENGWQYFNMSTPPNAFGPGPDTKQFGTYSEYFSSIDRSTNQDFFSENTIPGDYLSPDLAALTDDATGVCPESALLLQDKNVLGPSAVYDVANRLAFHLIAGLFSENFLLSGSECDAHGIDSVIYDNLSHLVPTAISYSRGLLDHFFRGRLTLIQEDNGSLTVRNDSFGPDPTGDFDIRPVSGAPAPKLIFAVENSQGKRTEIRPTPLPLGGLASGESFNIPDFAESVKLGGGQRVYAVVDHALVGQELGVAAGCVDWCSGVCSQGLMLPALVGLGDANGDGGGDFAVAMPNDVLTGGSLPFGSVRAFSSTGCAELWRVVGQDSLLFGANMVDAGFLDSDNVHDLVAYGDSEARVLSGATGDLLNSYHQDDWGGEAIGDLNGDGKSELVFFNRSFETLIISAFDGTVVGTPTSSYGLPSRTTPSMDSDTARDLMITGPTAKIISSADGALLYDGTTILNNEFGIYPPQLAIPNASGPGVLAFMGVTGDGATLALLDSLTGQPLWTRTRSSLGLDSFNLLEGEFDFNGDGISDILGFGYTFVAVAGLVEHIIVLDGGSGGVLADRTVDALSPLVLLPKSVGDLNRDGKDDVGYGKWDGASPMCLEFLFGK